MREEEKELESRFFIKQKDSKEPKNKSKYKKKKMNVSKDNCFQVGKSDVKVVVPQSDSEEEEIMANDNLSRPVAQPVEEEEGADIN